jgi:hypothetical protein
MWVDRETGRPATAGAAGAVFEAFLEGHLPDAGALDVDEGVGAESMEPTTSDDSLF